MAEFVKHTHEFLMDALQGIQFSNCLICGLPYPEFIRHVVEINARSGIAAGEVKELEDLWSLEAHD